MVRTAASRAIRIVSLALLLCAPLSQAGGEAQTWRQQEQATAESAFIALADLPSQGRKTYRLILQGGPFPHDKDGTVFGNREGLLPAMKRGYYREYTVETPGLRNRGARRIVCGGPEPTRPKACYYTSDHYSNFRRIIE
ncbi:MAG: ribonuclease [Burkholderiaceae bacterium]|jgi:ribonuclease T1|nr:ribonuclease [Burkholderiaceae bacterium]